MPVNTSTYSVGVPVKDSGSPTDPQLHVESGLTQLSEVSLAANTAVSMGITFQVNADNLTNTTLRPVYFAVTLEATTGNDYWWDDSSKKWTDYGSVFPSGYHDPGDANWIVTHLSSVYAYPSRITTHAIDIPSLPVAGQVRITLYNVVETQVLSPEEVTGVTYYGVQFDITDDEDASAGSTQTIVADNSSGLNRSRKPWTFWIGDGPTDFHRGRITYGSGTRATGWQSGAYSGGASSGLGLDNHHGTQILAARHRPLKRLACTFRIDSGDFWPHQPLLFDSVRYSTAYLSLDVRHCEYSVEAVELFTGSYTPAETSNLNPYVPQPSETGATATVRIPLYRDHIWMDAIADGTYGKVLTTSITAGQIILGQTSGDLDDIADGTTSVKWNASGVPPSATSVGSAGLYMGTDKMGYYDGSEWRTYMDSSGNLRLVDSDGASTFEVYVAGAPNQLSFSIEAATALGGYVILNSEDAKQMQLLAEDAKITLFGSNSSTAPGQPWIGFDGDLMADSSGHTIGGGPGGDSWAGLYIEGPGQFANGSAAAPSVSFTADTDTGMYRLGANNIAFATQGVLRMDVDGTSITMQKPVYNANGSASAPSVTFTSDTNTGVYRIGADQLGISTGGTKRASFNTADITLDATVKTVDLQPGLDDFYTLGTASFQWSHIYGVAATLSGATVNMTGLATSDPAVAGRLWNDSGTLKVSAG